jgi:hypothetical protein
MIAAYPEAAQKKDKLLKLPLHWAAEKRASDAILNVLLAAYPAAVMEKDAMGSIPKLSPARGGLADVLSGAPAPAKPCIHVPIEDVRSSLTKPIQDVRSSLTKHVPIEDERSSLTKGVPVGLTYPLTLTNADAAPRAKLPAIKVIGVAAVAADPSAA